MSFDPMATAVDWLDAYRAGDIQAILEMYAEDAVVHCGCDELTNTGREGPPSLLGCSSAQTPRCRAGRSSAFARCDSDLVHQRGKCSVRVTPR